MPQRRSTSRSKPSVTSDPSQPKPRHGLWFASETVEQIKQMNDAAKQQAAGQSQPAADQATEIKK